MGHDLDSLLDSTGLGEMAGTKYEKTAAEEEGEPYDFQKLAQQCRDAATEPAAHREARGRELVEKTAAVTVIAKTIDEINSIIGDPVEKIASDPDTVRFVNEALDRGFQPEKIASFIKEAGPVGRWVGGKARAAIASLRARSGQRLTSEGRLLENRAKAGYRRELRDVARTDNLNKQRDVVEKLKQKFGPREAGKIIDSSGAQLKVPGAAALRNKAEAASATIGGKKLSISRSAAGKAAPVAAGAAGAYALTRNKKDKGKNGVTVIRG